MKKLFYSIIIILLVSSCGKLSKDKAIELISQKEGLPKKCGIIIPQSFRVYYEDNEFQMPCYGCGDFEIPQKFKKMKDDGYITYSEQERVPHGSWNKPYILYQISITDKGKSLVIDESTLSEEMKNSIKFWAGDNPHFYIHIGDMYVKDINLIQKKDIANASFAMSFKDTTSIFSTTHMEKGFRIIGAFYKIDMMMQKPDELKMVGTTSFSKWDDGWHVNKVRY